MRRICRALAVAILLAGFARDAHADSDGWFCVGPNYVGYELSFSAGQDGHFLGVATLGGKDGISGPARVTIPDFQVHGMACKRDSVELLGWEAVYVVDIRNPLSPALTDTRRLTKSGQQVEGIPAVERNLLTGWPTADGIRPSQNLALTSTNPDSSYRLELILGPHDSDSCQVPVITSIVQLDKRGQTTKRVTLVKGIRHEECGE